MSDRPSIDWQYPDICEPPDIPRRVEAQEVVEPVKFNPDPEIGGLSDFDMLTLTLCLLMLILWLPVLMQVFALLF